MLLTEAHITTGKVAQVITSHTTDHVTEMAWLLIDFITVVNLSTESMECLLFLK